MTRAFDRSATRRTRLLATVLGAAALTAAAPGASAVTLLYNDFSSLAGLQVNGTTAGIHACGVGGDGSTCSAVTDSLGNDVLRLTNATGQSGSAFSTSAISLDANASFSTAFQFHFSDPINGGADGIVFTVQTVANTAGGGGGGIGYDGLLNSVGIEFDNWDNGAIDGNSDNHVGINLNGSVDSVARSTAIATLDNPANIFTAWVDYNGVTDLLEVRVNTTGVRPTDALLSHTVDLVSVLGSTDAFVGFTSGTGFAGADHDILSWQFNSTFDPISTIGVPEPGALALASLGLVVAGARRRRNA